MMEEISKYKIFRTRAIYGIGEIFVLITGEKKLNEINTEWYYLIPYANTIEKDVYNPRGSQIIKVILDDKIVSKKINFTSFETIENCWEHETLKDVRQTIYYNEIMSVQENNKDYILKGIPKIIDYKDIGLYELKKDYLFHINIGHYSFIDYLRENTNCESLMEILNTMPIMRNGKYIKNKRINNGVRANGV